MIDPTSSSERLWRLEGRLKGLKVFRTPGEPDYALILFGALPYLASLVAAIESRAHPDDAGFLTGLDHPTPCAVCEALRGLKEALEQ